MSTSVASPPTQSQKPQRVLACVLCQQRKVKCDRKFPCANCVKSRVQCIPATLTQRRRRRRFPERELLERLRKYEDLLRRNNIPFDSLHKDGPQGMDTPDAEQGDDFADEHHEDDMPNLASLSTNERNYEAKSPFHIMSKGYRNPDNESNSSNDDLRERQVKEEWDEIIENHENLLFGSRVKTIDLSLSHPDPVQIFRLWQIYLDNVNPLLRVTHAPTMQGRIIEAVGNISNVNATFEALMFSIYCMAILSLPAEECQTIFGSPKDDVLFKYQICCKQALSNCESLRTSDRDCLTALFLYLVSIRTTIVPQSLSSMLGIAMRIARRIGIHSETYLAKCSVLEAEMRRRLWWALVLFDCRIGELSKSNSLPLEPTWDCKVPLNVNDSELLPEMKEPPTVQGKLSEALFAVVRSELSDNVRFTTIYLEFLNPSLLPIVKDRRDSFPPAESEFNRIETLLEEKYLKSCDENNPLHYMTMWMTRKYLAKFLLVEHLGRLVHVTSRRTDIQHEAATTFALRTLECDTKIMTSPLTKRFRWLNLMYFPFPAFFQLAQELRRRPESEQTPQMWEAMSTSFEAWFDAPVSTGHFFRIFTKIILQAWDACEPVLNQQQQQRGGQPYAVPSIVAAMKQRQTQIGQQSPYADTDVSSTNADMNIDNFIDELSAPMSLSMDFEKQGGGMPFDMTGMPGGFSPTGQNVFAGMPGQLPLPPHLTQFDWTSYGRRPVWGGF